MSNINAAVEECAATRLNRRRVRWFTAIMSCFVLLAIAAALAAPAISATEDTLELAPEQASTTAVSEAADDDAATDGSQDAPDCLATGSDPDQAAVSPDGKNQSGSTAAGTDAASSSASEGADKSAADESAADMPAQSFSKELKNADGEVTFAIAIEAPEGALPADSTMQVKKVAAKTVKDAVGEAVSEKTDDEVAKIEAVAVTFKDATGEYVEPEADVAVTVTSPEIAQKNEPYVVNVDEDGTATVVDQLTDEQLEQRDQELEDNELAFDTDATATYAIAYTISTQVLTADGETFTITVTYDDAAGIPDGATLEASEIPEDSEAYEEHFTGALGALEDRDVSISAARFFDVQILNGDERVEPAAPVQVKIESQDRLVADDADELCIVHFADEGTEVIDDVQTNDNATDVTYEQAGFSVIGAVATTNAGGWPTSNGEYVLVLKSGSDYYAVAQDGTLKRVKYFNGTVTFVGEGTTDVAYLRNNNFVWNFTASGAVRGYLSTGSGNIGSGTYVDPNAASALSTSARQLQVQDGKVFTRYYNNYYTLSAAEGEGGQLKNTGLYDDDASPFFLAPVSGFTANDNESDMFSLVDVEAMVQMWKERMNQKLTTDKTAEVYDYDNRIYQVDLEASSGYNVADPALALEFVVDCSRSMYFPAKLNEVARYTTTSANDSTEVSAIREWLRTADESQVYYIITDPNTTSDVTAIWHDEKGWCFGDASYYHTQDSTTLGMRGGIYGHVYDKSLYVPNPKKDDPVVGAGRDPDDFTIFNPRVFDGKIYTSEARVEGQPWCRLDYLKLAVEAAAQVVYAVNPNTEIGIVKFAADASLSPTPGIYDNAHAEDLYNEIRNIAVIGGTNHAAGLQRANEKFSNYTDSNGRQHAVVLVTDGAPRGSTWELAGVQADALKGKTAGGKSTDLYTLGLSMKNVGQNKDHLFGIATEGDGYTYDAESGDEIVNCVTKIIENMLHQANLKGNVVDVVDPAFYPVDPTTGRPLESGAWLTADGAVVEEGDERAIGQATWDDTTKQWTVRWDNQRIDWPTTDALGETILQPGWHGRLYVKAKEDFLGGDGITTNASGTQVEPVSYINYKKQETPLPEADKTPQVLETPAVNVDELELTEHSTEWTVALGTEVDPRAELQALWNDIKVKEVVSKSDEDHVIAADGNTTYTIAPESTEDGRDAVADREEFALSAVANLSANNWNTLISRGWFEVPYSAYGHDRVGTIRVELEKTVKPGERGLNPSPHATTVVDDAVEAYTLTVRYTPHDSSVSNYHTGSHGTGRPGDNADTMKSENTHVINVFAKNLQLQKVDTEGNPLVVSDPACFQLYVADDENGSTVEGLEGKYSPVGDELVANQTVDGTGAWTVPTGYLSVGTYWLVETHTPAGYNTVSPLEVQVLAGQDDFTPVLPSATEGGEPFGFNWTQSGTINIPETSFVSLSGAEPGAANVYTTDTTVKYEVKNSPGKPLPNTGGSGTTVVYLLGTLMVAAAATFLVRRKITGVRCR